MKEVYLWLALSKQVIHAFTTATIITFAFLLLANHHVKHHVAKNEYEKEDYEKRHYSVENHYFEPIIATFSNDTHPPVVTGRASNFDRLTWQCIKSVFNCGFRIFTSFICCFSFFDIIIFLFILGFHIFLLFSLFASASRRLIIIFIIFFLLLHSFCVLLFCIDLSHLLSLKLKLIWLTLRHLLVKAGTAFSFFSICIHLLHYHQTEVRASHREVPFSFVSTLFYY